MESHPPDRQSIIPIRNVHPNDEVVQTSIRSKLEAKKVKVIDIRIFRSSQGTFTRGDVKIEPAAGTAELSPIMG